jgi:hypothetical protein
MVSEMAIVGRKLMLLRTILLYQSSYTTHLRELSYVRIVLTVYHFLDLDTNIATVDCRSDDTPFGQINFHP